MKAVLFIVLWLFVPFGFAEDAPPNPKPSDKPKNIAIGLAADISKQFGEELDLIKREPASAKKEVKNQSKPVLAKKAMKRKPKPAVRPEPKKQGAPKPTLKPPGALSGALRVSISYPDFTANEKEKYKQLILDRQDEFLRRGIRYVDLDYPTKIWWASNNELAFTAAVLNKDWKNAEVEFERTFEALDRGFDGFLIEFQNDHSSLRKKQFAELLDYIEDIQDDIRAAKINIITMCNNNSSYSHNNGRTRGWKLVLDTLGEKVDAIKEQLDLSIRTFKRGLNLSSLVVSISYRDFTEDEERTLKRRVQDRSAEFLARGIRYVDLGYSAKIEWLSKNELKIEVAILNKDWENAEAEFDRFFEILDRNFDGFLVVYESSYSRLNQKQFSELLDYLGEIQGDIRAAMINRITLSNISGHNWRSNGRTMGWHITLDTAGESLSAIKAEMEEKIRILRQ